MFSLQLLSSRKFYSQMQTNSAGEFYLLSRLDPNLGCENQLCLYIPLKSCSLLIPLDINQVFWGWFFLAISELQKYKMRDEGLVIHHITYITPEPHRSWALMNYEYLWKQTLFPYFSELWAPEETTCLFSVPREGLAEEIIHQGIKRDR